MKHYSSICEENYLDDDLKMKPFLLHKGVLEYKEQLIWFKWKFVFRNVSEKVLVSIKHIIHTLIVFITLTYGFRPVRSDLNYNYPITFRYYINTTTLR